MPAQLFLHGLAPQRAPVSAGPWAAREPVFFALTPPPAIKAEVLALAQHLRATHGSNVRLARNPHVSLLGLHDVSELPSANLNDVKAAASTLTFEPFEVVFDRAQCFGRNGARRPIVLRACEGEGRMVMMGQQLRRALIKAGVLQPRKWTFVPHLTLLRGPWIEERYVPPIVWTVREVVLIHSERAAGRHNVLAHIPALG